tara:strand:+ start:1358 stop:2047 length:690 start_codon:yes stop_codon:yes gene_type:complete
MSVHIAIERSDGKRQMIPIQGNSALKLDAAGDAKLVSDVAESSLKNVDFTEAFTTSAATASTKTFVVTGNQTARFTPGVKFTIENATANANEGAIFTTQGATYASPNTTITVAETVTTASDGDLLIYDLILRPSTGTVVRVTNVAVITTESSAPGSTANINLENGTIGNDILNSDLALSTFAANKVYDGGALASPELIVTNTAPLYLRRNAQDSGTTAKGHLVVTGVAI